METVDYKAHLRKFYRPISEEVELVEVPRLNFIMIDGSGNPDTSPEYVNAVDALFAVSNLLKIMVKRGKPPIDYGVMPLEALWWSNDLSRFSVDRKADWKWTLMIIRLLTAAAPRRPGEKCTPRNAIISASSKTSG